MKKIYHKYTDWEDYKNGMYETENIKDKEFLVQKSIYLLSDDKAFYEVCLKVLDEWTVSSDVNLSNTGVNRRAWLGQAACSYNHNCTEILTREAWSKIDSYRQNKANNVADKIIRIYERKNRELHSNLGTKMLF